VPAMRRKNGVTLSILFKLSKEEEEEEEEYL
jgi:CRISPR/Cas system CMR-associated protein Cmr5 small subunit